MATIRSTPPRRPRWPRSVTRTSYHVGRPWMLDGKMLRGLTGTPMRRMARAKSSLAEAEPEPLTLANLTTQSLTDSILFMSGRSSGCFPLRAAARRPGLRHLEQEFLHVPCAGRAALGAQAAVQAHVLVLGHDAAGLEAVGDVDVLGRVERGRVELPAQVVLLRV